MEAENLNLQDNLDTMYKETKRVILTFPEGKELKKDEQFLIFPTLGAAIDWLEDKGFASHRVQHYAYHGGSLTLQLKDGATIECGLSSGLFIERQD